MGRVESSSLEIASGFFSTMFSSGLLLSESLLDASFSPSMHSSASISEVLSSSSDLVSCLGLGLVSLGLAPIGWLLWSESESSESASAFWYFKSGESGFGQGRGVTSHF